MEENLSETSVDLACRRGLGFGGIGGPGREIQACYQKLGLNTSIEDCFLPKCHFLSLSSPDSPARPLYSDF